MNAPTACELPYERIVFEDLQISERFFEDREPILRDRLRTAAPQLGKTVRDVRDPRDMNGINQVFRLASSVVLRGSANVAAALEKIRNEPAFQKKDPTTIVTIATLYCLLDYLRERASAPKDQEDIARISRRFAEMDWMVGEDGMRSLGITRCDKPSVD